MQPNATPTKNPDEISDESRGIAHYNSDTDDWTFVSSASSASRGTSNSSSPERGSLGTTNTTSLVRDTATTTALGTTSRQSATSCNQTTQAGTAQQQQSTDSTTSSELPLSQQPKAKKHISHHKRKIGSCERADDADDESDGMTEINLSDSNADEHSISCTSSGNHGLTTVRMENLTEEEEQKPSKEQDLQSLEDEVGRVARHTQQMATLVHEVAAAIHMRKPISTSTEAPLSTVATLSNSESTQTTHELRQGDTQSKGPNWDLLRKAAYRLPLVMLALFMLANRHFKLNNKVPDSANNTTSNAKLLVDNATFDSVYLDPTNHAHTELKLMHEEMVECIRRENPNRKEIEHWLSMNSQELDSYHSTQTNIRPFKGLVCYEREVEWRKRFNRLKSEFSLDLRKITRQIKRKITNEMLEKQHPALSFRLILNQLEYLDHVDQRRKDRALEKLKAENLELVRRLNKKSSSSSEVKNKSQQSHSHRHHEQKHKHYDTATHSGSNSLISLESENARLKHEIESLKARLAEKAGTVFIKQSLELEKCDRENNALKQFHQQVAQEVARNLKQLDQSHSMESLAIFEHDHDESLGLRLSSTSTSLLHLGEGITTMLAKNKQLESDLKEAQSLNEMMLTDTKNLIEDANQTETAVDREAPQPLPEPNHDEALGAGIANFPSDEQQLVQMAIDHFQHKHRQHVKDFRGDWLMKRAKLREKLRRTPAQSSEPKHSPVSRHYARHVHKLNMRTAPPSHYWAGSLDDEIYKSDEQRGQRNRRKPYRSASHESSNSYGHNSHRNCKHHLKRDEL